MIRKANEKDAEFILGLAKKTPELSVSKTEMWNPTKKEIIEWIKDEKNIFLVKENKGFLLAKLNSSEWCMIDALAIKLEYRSQGIATELLEELYSILKEKNIEYISGLVQESCMNARAFWNKKGYKEGKKLIWFEKTQTKKTTTTF